MIENFLILFGGLIAVFTLAGVLAYLCDWLEERFPWKDLW